MSEEIKAVYNGERGWSDTDFFFQSNINQKSESWNAAPEPSLEEFFA